MLRSRKLYTLLLIAVVFVNFSVNFYRSNLPPRKVAFRFLEVLYNDKNLDEALHLTSGYMRETLFRFKDTREATIFVFNRDFDSILITGESVDNPELYSERGGRIEIFFIGRKRRDSIKVSQTLTLKQIDDCWYVVRCTLTYIRKSHEKNTCIFI